MNERACGVLRLDAALAFAIGILGSTESFLLRTKNDVQRYRWRIQICQKVLVNSTFHTPHSQFMSRKKVSSVPECEMWSGKCGIRQRYLERCFFDSCQ